MSALPYIPLYVADYLADTSHLSTLEHGAYLLLIMNYWQRGKALPAGDVHLSRITRLTMDEWLAAKPLISEFFVEVDGEWRNDRVETELEHVRNKSATKAKAGKASAKAKAQQRGNTSSTPVEHMPNYTDTDTDIDPPIPPKGVGGDGFAEFWQSYPERNGTADQPKAKLAFYDCLLRASSADLIAAANAYRQWCIDNGKIRTQYVKTAHLWLSDGAWVEWVPKVATAMASMVLHKPGSPQWDAWQAHRRTPISDKTGGWHFPSEWPPGHVKTSEAA